MLTKTHAAQLEAFHLGNGCQFHLGCVPAEHAWDPITFDRVWALHPADRHVVVIITPKLTPRWQQAYGASYRYTGSSNDALPIPRLLRSLLKWCQANIEPGLNGLLLNWYEGPDDYIGEHRDSVKGLVDGTPIVTVSFGEERTFRLARGKGSDKQTHDFQAPHGTLFVMPWESNLTWKHAVPKRASYYGRRISVTLRAFASGVLPPEKYFAD